MQPLVLYRVKASTNKQEVKNVFFQSYLNHIWGTDVVFYNVQSMDYIQHRTRNNGIELLVCDR